MTAASPWARDDLEYLVAVTVRHADGGVLAHVDTEVPLEVGDRISVTGRPLLEVTGMSEQIKSNGWFQLVDVSEVADAAPVSDVATPPDHGDWTHVLITVRDARFGRDPDLATGAGGEVLDRFRSDRTCEVGEMLDLPDGTQAKVVSSREVVTPADWLQTVEVGDVWPTEES